MADRSRDGDGGRQRSSRRMAGVKMIRALFDRWNRSLMSGDPEKVVECYAPDAVLLPTFSAGPCLTQAERRGYFEHFMRKKPRGRIDESHVRIFGDIAVDSGLYSFVLADGRITRARYTFVYRRDGNGGWKIIEHHSSALPEPM